MILKSNIYHEHNLGPATCFGTGRSGMPKVRRNSVYRDKGDLFWADPADAKKIIEAGNAREARLAGVLAALAGATLTASTPVEAALAGFSLPRVLVWHARKQDGYWIPFPTALGPARGPFSAHFSNAAEIRETWAEKPEAVPLFSFLTEHRFRHAFIWHARGLSEIATEIQMSGR